MASLCLSTLWALVANSLRFAILFYHSMACKTPSSSSSSFRNHPNKSLGLLSQCNFAISSDTTQLFYLSIYLSWKFHRFLSLTHLISIMAEPLTWFSNFLLPCGKAESTRFRRRSFILSTNELNKKQNVLEIVVMRKKLLKWTGENLFGWGRRRQNDFYSPVGRKFSF